ncbi:MAG: ATP-binding protein [Anaerostipes sp.]|jgi:signal transduction histidine kinase/CheY-like chemotaxis protein
MMKYGKKIIVGIFIFLFSMFLFTNLTTHADEKKTTIRVAYYPLHGFFEYNSKGKETGYGIELLDKISQYTGINFEYVKADSWEITKGMLLNGKADLRMPGTVPSTPSKELDYNATSILATYNAIMCLDSRDDLYYKDYTKFKKIKIAVSTNFYKLNLVQEYLNQIGVNKKQIVFTDGYNESYQLLKEKKVDALISNVMDMNGKMKLLSRFQNQYNYFSMVKGDSRLDILENAMTDIAVNEPTFLNELYSKWFPERVNNPYTAEERKYLSTIDTLTFAFQPNEGYLSRYENGKYYGIYVELAKKVCSKLGVKFKAVSLKDCQEGKAVTDVYSGFFFDQNYADKYNYSISAPINNINYYIVKKKEKIFDVKTCKIAAIKKFRYTKDYIVRKYPKASMVYFDTYEECLRAVENEKADMTILNNYIAEYYLGKYQYSDLSTSLSDEYSHLYCFATENKNEILAAVLSKGLQQISETETSQIYIKGQEERPRSNYMETMIYQNPIQVVLAAMGLLALVFAVTFLLFYGNRRKKQNIKLAEALSAKSDFLARMSHDMRTPMNGILGLTELLQEEDMSDEVRNAISQIQLSGEYLLDLINDTLDMNKIELKQLILSPAPTDLEEITENVMTNGKILASQKGIHFIMKKTYPENMTSTYLYIDRARMEQIFMNLISNAVKFTPKGGTVTVSIECLEMNKDSIVSQYVIEDTGIGMSEEFMEHLYEPFTREEQKRIQNHEGTGLGLSIVKQLVDLMNGDIKVESKEGKGTKFILKIPLKRYFGEIKQHKMIDFDEKNLEGKRILLCEDHPLNQAISVKLLEKKKIIVDVAEDGAVGVEMYLASKEGYYDAILMDLRMPNMDGYEATDRIRNLGRSDSLTIPIIAMTANAFDEDIQKCLKAGMNAHIAKPIDVKHLYETLERCLQC